MGGNRWEDPVQRLRPYQVGMADQVQHRGPGQLGQKEPVWEHPRAEPVQHQIPGQVGCADPIQHFVKGEVDPVSHRRPIPAGQASQIGRGPPVQHLRPSHIGLKDHAVKHPRPGPVGFPNAFLGRSIAETLKKSPDVIAESTQSVQNADFTKAVQNVVPSQNETLKRSPDVTAESTQTVQNVGPNQI